MVRPLAVSSNSVYLFEHFHPDYRAEVIATGLLAGDAANAPVPLARLLFTPLGPNARPYSQDFTTRNFLAATSDDDPYLSFESPREGLYDQLPSFLFHALVPVQGEHADPDLILEQFREAHIAEAQARLFFWPFDTEIYYLRVLRCQYERQQDHLDDHRVLLEQFAEAWPILGALNPFQAGLFVQLLPFVHQLRGDLPWLSRFLEVFLGVPVSFTTGQRIVHPMLTEPALALGQCQLGLSAMTGNAVSDAYDGIGVNVGGVPPARVAEFLPHGSATALLGQILDYFMPASTELVVVVSIGYSPEPATGGPATYLGYNSYL